MQSVSETYKALWREKARREVKAVIGGETYNEDRLFSVDTSAALFDSTVSVGNSVAVTADLVLQNPGTIPRMAKIELYVRLNRRADISPNFLTAWDAFGTVFAFDETGTARLSIIRRSASAETPVKRADRISKLQGIINFMTSLSAMDARLEWDSNAAEYEATGNDIGDVSVSGKGTDGTTKVLRLSELAECLNQTGKSEWIPKGVFYIDEREYDKEANRLTLTAYDAMLKTEPAFCTPGEQGYWPRTDIVMVDEICERIGVTLDSRTRAILTNGFLVQYPGIVLEDGTPQYSADGSYSMREVLGYIGAMYAGNWMMSDSGELRLVALGDIPAETSLLVEEYGDYILIGGIRLRV